MKFALKWIAGLISTTIVHKPYVSIQQVTQCGTPTDFRPDAVITS